MSLSFLTKKLHAHIKMPDIIDKNSQEAIFHFLDGSLAPAAPVGQ